MPSLSSMSTFALSRCEITFSSLISKSVNNISYNRNISSEGTCGTERTTMRRIKQLKLWSNFFRFYAAWNIPCAYLRRWYSNMGSCQYLLLMKELLTLANLVQLFHFRIPISTCLFCLIDEQLSLPHVPMYAFTEILSISKLLMLMTRFIQAKFSSHTTWIDQSQWVYISTILESSIANTVQVITSYKCVQPFRPFCSTAFLAIDFCSTEVYG